MNINISVKSLGDIAQAIEVQGELDVYTSPQLKELIADILSKQQTNLIIDLNKVRYIDSTGLGVIIGTLKSVREIQKRIVLVCKVNQILSVLSITGLTKILTICDTVDAAKLALNS